MNLRKKAAKGVIWSVIHRWGKAAVSTVTFIILARLLPPEAFGLVALATVFTAFVEIFIDSGFGAAIVQRSELTPEHLDTAFWTSVLIGVLMAVGGITVAGLVAAFYGEPDLAPILRWLSISFIVIALGSTQMAILRRKLAFKNIAARSLVATLVGGIVGVTMALNGYGVWSLVGQNLASGLAAVIVLWRASGWRPGLNFSKNHFKELFSFGISISGNKVLTFFSRRSDDLLIGYFLGPTMLGFYAVGYRLLLVMMRIVTGITNAVAFPTFSRIQHKPEKMRRGFYNVTQYTSLLAFPAFIGIAVLAPEVVEAFFGEQWLPSVPVMQVLVFIGILQSVLHFNGSVINASGKPSWQLGILFLTSMGSVIGFLIAVQWGIVAVAAAFVIVGYLVAPVSYFAVRKLIQVDFKTYLIQFLAPLSASLIMVAVIMSLKYLLKDQDLNLYLELFIYVMAGVATYLIVIGFTARHLARQVFELVRLALPDWKFLKTQKFTISATKENLPNDG
jgi:PST family polysaccharide transporter